MNKEKNAKFSKKSSSKASKKKSAKRAITENDTGQSARQLEGNIPLKNNSKKKTDLIDHLIDENSTLDETSVDPEALERGDKPMTIVEHLNELRSRLLIILSALIIIMIATFGFSDYVIMFIARPFSVTGQKLNLFTIFEGFSLRLKSSLFISLMLCLPLIVYHIWKYIEPAINRSDRNIVRITLLLAIFLFYAGTIFAYFFIPLAIRALMSFAPSDMLITNNATEYFNFFVISSLILGAIFELPIMVLLLTKMGLISPVFLIQKRKYAIVLIWIIAAVASPGPDPLSQALLALPLMFLYELSIVISKIIIRRKKKKELLNHT